MREPDSQCFELSTGLKQHVLQWEPESKPEGSASEHTVVLVHGFLDSAWSFERVANILSEHVHVIAPDLRGHGDSGWLSGGGYYHFVDYVADLHDLIRQLGRNKVSLVGHSLGGVISGFYAGTFPQAVSNLVLIEGMGPKESEFTLPLRIARWIESWDGVTKQPRRFYKSIEEAAARLQKSDPLLTDAVALSLAKRVTHADSSGVRFKHDPLHLTRAPYPFVVSTAKEFWQRIAVPTLFIDGEKSRFANLQSDAAEREAWIAHASKKIVANAGHWIQLHQPEALAALLTEELGLRS